MSFNDQHIKFDAIDLFSSSYYTQNMIKINIFKSFFFF